MRIEGILDQLPQPAVGRVVLEAWMPMLADRKRRHIVPLMIAATICWMLVYMLAHVVLLVLRPRRPDVARPFKTPFYPLPQVAATAAIVYVICNSSPEPTMTRSIMLYSGSVLAIFGAVAAFWVKVVMKQPLFAAVPVADDKVEVGVKAA